MPIHVIHANLARSVDGLDLYGIDHASVADDSTPQPEDPLLTPDDAARRLAIGLRTLNRWAADGRVFAYRLPNGHRRFRTSDIEALLTPERSAS